MLNPTRYKLITPIKVDGEDVSDLPVRELKLKDLVAAGKADTDEEKTAMLLAAITSTNLREIGELSMTDFLGLSEVLAGFLDNGDGTSKVSPQAKSKRQ